MIAKNGTLAEWLDRAVPITLPATCLTDSDKTAIKHNNGLLQDLYGQLPILVSSKNDRRSVGIKERFGWKTKREIRLYLLRQVLDDLNDNALEELTRLIRSHPA